MDMSVWRGGIGEARAEKKMNRTDATGPVDVHGLDQVGWKGVGEGLLFSSDNGSAS